MSKAKANKTVQPEYSSAFAHDLIEGMNELLADLKAGKLNARGPTVPVSVPDMPPEAVRAVRESLNVSQPLFAELIGASPATVKAWEQGRKVPSPMARRLLGTIQAVPDYWAKQLAETTRGRATKRNV